MGSFRDRISDFKILAMFKVLCALFIANVNPRRPWVSQMFFYVLRFHTATLFYKFLVATLHVACSHLPAWQPRGVKEF